ncbi:MAG: hypothetical protein K6E39_05065, partial [Lachnospiraceae bacterium]|nr:hypothetical protein [Lachnospiraceae bacterium]
MKKEELFEVLEDIDPSSVEKARIYKKKKNGIWTKAVAAVACLAIIIGAIWGVPSLRNAGSLNNTGAKESV